MKHRDDENRREHQRQYDRIAHHGRTTCSRHHVLPEVLHTV